MLQLYSTALLAVIGANALVVLLAIVGAVKQPKARLQQTQPLHPARIEAGFEQEGKPASGG